MTNRNRDNFDDDELGDERTRSQHGGNAQERGRERGGYGNGGNGGQAGYGDRDSRREGSYGQSGSQGSYRQDSEGGWGRQLPSTSSRGWSGNDSGSSGRSGVGEPMLGDGGYSGSYDNRGRGSYGAGYGSNPSGNWSSNPSSREAHEPSGGRNPERGERGQQRGPHAGKGPKGYQRSDDRLKEEISDRLTDDPEIDAGEIEIDVEKGIVTLRGTIDSRDVKWRVESLCDGVSGVQDVQNQLRVQRQTSQQGSGAGGRESSASSSSRSTGGGSAGSSGNRTSGSASGSSSSSGSVSGSSSTASGSQGRKPGSAGNAD